MSTLQNNIASLEALITKANALPEEKTIQSSKTVTPTTSSQTVKPDSGYDGMGQVVVNAMPTATQATPSVSIDSAGKITATATQSAGYVAAGTKTGTKQLTTQAAKTITPTKSSQTAVASGVYTTGAVTVAAIPSTYVKPTATKAAATYTPSTSNQTIAAGTYCSGAQTIKGDANLVADNIKSGVSIFGVSGTMEPKEFSIVTTVESGATVTATKSSTTISGTSTNGSCTLKVPTAGSWTVKATTTGNEWGETETTSSKTVTTVNSFSTSLSFWRATLTVLTVEGATITVTNGSKTYTKTAGSTAVASFQILSAGTWTITGVNGDESETTTVAISSAATYTAEVLTPYTVDATLNNNDWDLIQRVSNGGAGANYWAVGDTKQITINGTVGNTTFSNLSVWAFILGFDHNSSVEGTGRIHFQIGKTAQTGGRDICLIDSKYNSTSASAGYFNMNYSSSNSGGWASSKIRTVLLGNSNTPASPLSGSLMAALPSDLRSVMKACTKYSDNTGGSSNTASYVTATTDYLWLLAEWEVHGTRTYANSAEQNYQKQYTYYANGNSKIKYRHSATTSTAFWWLRSARATSSYYFCFVSTSGSADRSNADLSFGLAPAFCV